MPSSLIMRGYIDPTFLQEYEVYMKLMDTALRDDQFVVVLNKKMDKDFAKYDSKFADTTPSRIRSYNSCLNATFKRLLHDYEANATLSIYHERLDANREILSSRIKSIENERIMYITSLIREQWHYARDMAIPINKEYKKYYALLVFCRYVVYEHRREVYDQINDLIDTRRDILACGDTSVFKRVERYNINYSLDKLAVYVDKFIASISDFSKVKKEIEECFRRLI